MHSFMFFSPSSPVASVCWRLNYWRNYVHRSVGLSSRPSPHFVSRQHIPATEAPLLWCGFPLATLCHWARWCEMWMESERAVCDRESMCCRALSLIATGIPNDSWSTLLLDCSPKRRHHVHSKHYPSAPSALVLPLLEEKYPLCHHNDPSYSAREKCVCSWITHTTLGWGWRVYYHQVCAWIFHVEWQCKHWAVASLF